MAEVQLNEADIQELKERLRLIIEVDPSQYHNEFSLRRYLKAFKTVDNSFKVCDEFVFPKPILIVYYIFLGYIKNKQMEK